MTRFTDMRRETDDGAEEALAREWLDGALAPDSPEAARARAALEADPGLAARIEADRLAEHRLAAALDAYAHPRERGRAPVLRARAARRAERADRWVRTCAAAAAAVLVFAGGWLAGTLPGAGSGPFDAAPPTELVMLGGQAADASAFQSGFLQESALTPPELSGHGLQLTAAITRAAPDGALNALEYQASGGETVRILARRISPSGPGDLHHGRLEGEPIVWWREDDLVIGVTGPLARTDLEAIAETVRSQSRPPNVADFTPAPELGVQTVNDPG
ncbi:MAG: hypothetical protein JJU18_13750 [Oceanicaulis sp.]|nr:hypothetical protein [Oceanicaulis sp.]